MQVVVAALIIGTASHCAVTVGKVLYVVNLV